MTISLPRLPWHWRLRRLLGFDSTRRRGILFIPRELGPPADDRLLNELIAMMCKPVGPPRLSRRTRLRRLLGFDSERHRRSTRDAKSMVPLIIRGPLLEGTHP